MARYCPAFNIMVLTSLMNTSVLSSWATINGLSVMSGPNPLTKMYFVSFELEFLMFSIGTIWSNPKSKLLLLSPLVPPKEPQLNAIGLVALTNAPINPSLFAILMSSVAKT